MADQLGAGQAIVRPGGATIAARGAQAGLGNELADKRQRLEAMKQVWVQKNYPQLGGIAGRARMTPELQAKIDQEFMDFMKAQIAKAQQQQQAAPPPAQPGVPAPPPGQGPGVSAGGPPPAPAPAPPPQGMAPPPQAQPGLPQPGLAPRAAPAR